MEIFHIRTYDDTSVRVFLTLVIQFFFPVAPSPDWTGIIVGIALGSLGCIATCAFIIYVCVLRYRRKKTSCKY